MRWMGWGSREAWGVGGGRGQCVCGLHVREVGNIRCVRLGMVSGYLEIHTTSDVYLQINKQINKHIDRRISPLSYPSQPQSRSQPANPCPQLSEPSPKTTVPQHPLPPPYLSPSPPICPSIYPSIHINTPAPNAIPLPRPPSGPQTNSTQPRPSARILTKHIHTYIRTCMSWLSYILW